MQAGRKAGKQGGGGAGRQAGRQTQPGTKQRRIHLQFHGISVLMSVFIDFFL